MIQTCNYAVDPADMAAAVVALDNVHHIKLTSERAGQAIVRCIEGLHAGVQEHSSGKDSKLVSRQQASPAMQRALPQCSNIELKAPIASKEQMLDGLSNNDSNSQAGCATGAAAHIMQRGR